MAHRGLAHPVTWADASGDDHGGSQAGAVELHRVIESGFQYGRRVTVVLGGSQDHDGIRRATLIQPANPPDPAEENAVQEHHHADQAESPAQRSLHNSNDSPS